MYVLIDHTVATAVVGLRHAHFLSNSFTLEERLHLEERVF